MKFQFTLEITRTPKEEPDFYDVSGAQIEHAGQQRAGFYATPSRDRDDL